MTHQSPLVVRQSVILSSKTSDNVLTPEGVGLLFDLEIKAHQLPGYNDTCLKRGAGAGRGSAGVCLICSYSIHFFFHTPFPSPLLFDLSLL